MRSVSTSVLSMSMLVGSPMIPTGATTEVIWEANAMLGRLGYWINIDNV